jgi:tetratricopeptide (TPR) repeat protein
MLKLSYRGAFIKTLGIALFLFCVSKNLKAEDPSRFRAMGDAALRARDYKRAIKYYNNYKDSSTNDRISLRDAYIRLLSAYISASEVAEAQKELTAFTKAFPFDSGSLGALYQASIFMLERKYKEAEELLRLRLKDQPRKGDIYFQMLSTLGLSLRRQNRWDEAAEIYSILEKESKGSSWEFKAFQQRLFCLIMGEKLIESKKLFAESGKYKNYPDYSQLNLLMLLQMIKEKRFSELQKTYAKVIKDIEPVPNALIYKITQDAIKHFLKNDNPEGAVAFLRDAFKFAPNEHERQDSLLLLINTYVKVEQKKEAIKAALKYSELYYDNPKTPEVQIQCARLMAEEKMYADALAVYSSLLKEPRLTLKQRIAAAREAATIYELNGSPDKAVRMLSIIYDIAPTQAEKMEGRYLQGQIYYKQGNFKDAADAFEEVIKLECDWQNPAAYWALQSLLLLNNYEKALATAKELVKDKDNKFASAGQYYLAFCQEKLGNPEEALQAYESFIKLYPKDKLAPAAIFAAGKILFSQKKFAQVTELFKNLPEEYPDSEYTPNAVYKSIFACYQLQKWDKMAKLVRLLAEKYPKSDYTIAAEFWLVDSLRNRGEFTKAETWIKQMSSKYAEKPLVAAQLLYDSAMVAARSRQSQKALKLLEELFKKYPEDNINSKALFMAGDIASSEGNYALAVKYYQRAAKLNPATDFETACLGRIADCNYSLYNNTFDLKILEKAAEDYKRLLKNKDLDPSVRNQSKYKLGRCYELLSQENDALDMYNELLYGYQVDRAKGYDTKPVWVVKAARAAILIYLKIGNAEAAREAIRVYKILKEMNLKTGENFDGFIKNIQLKYSLDEPTEN